VIKNIFLDAGGVILDEKFFEDNSAVIIIRIIRQYNDGYSPDNYWSDIEEAVYRYAPKIYDYVLYKNLKNIDDFMNSKAQYKKEIKNTYHFELMDGIKDFLISFSKHYSIGILGQYGKDFKSFLNENNLLPYFTYTEIQDDYAVTKPDTRYFEAILGKCGCNPTESVMIGDRIDKDIIPAKAVGMRTIRLRIGIHRNQEPRTPEEIPNLTVGRLRDITNKKIKEMTASE
jgi:HAD superfamily hydrolase (TIGR01549 family)